MACVVLLCVFHTHRKIKKMGSENKVKPCFGCLVSLGSTGRNSSAGTWEGTPQLCSWGNRDEGPQPASVAPGPQVASGSWACLGTPLGLKSQI